MLLAEEAERCVEALLLRARLLLGDLAEATEAPRGSALGLGRILRQRGPDGAHGQQESREERRGVRGRDAECGRPAGRHHDSYWNSYSNEVGKKPDTENDTSMRFWRLERSLRSSMNT